MISGKLDYMQDPPPADLLPEVRSKYKDRYREQPTPPNTYYFFLNSKIAPFDKQEVREAVNYAIDSKALARLFGGRLEPGCNFLPPGDAGPQEDRSVPVGRPERAGRHREGRAAVKEAGVEGDEVTVYTNNDENRPEIGQYYTDLLNKIGFKAKLKTLDGGVYFATVGQRRRPRPQTGVRQLVPGLPAPGELHRSCVDGATDPADQQPEPRSTSTTRRSTRRSTS